MISDSGNVALSNATRYLPYASAFALASGLCYLWGYWGGFHIKILEHIEISSVVKLAVVPLALFLMYSLLTAIIGSRFAGRSSARNALRHIAAKRFGFGVKALVVGLILFSTFAMIYGTAWRWLSLMVLTIPPLLLLIIGTFAAQIMRFIPITNRFLRLMATLVIMSPFQCFGLGAYQGEIIREGTAFEYVVSGIEGYESREQMQVQSRLRVIGRAGDYKFLFDPGESAVLMAKLPENKILVIKSYDGFDHRAYLRKPFFQYGKQD